MSTDNELVFYHAPFTRSGTVRIMLEELGVPHRMQVLNLRKAEHRTPEYRAINRMAKVPSITHGETAVSEVAAICCYLADAFPDAKLAPPIGDPRRGPYLKWLFFVPTCLEPALMDRSLDRDPGPETRIGYGSFSRVLETIIAAVEPGPYVLGEMFSAADVVLGAGLRWAQMTGGLAGYGGATAYIKRFTERPAVQRALAADAKLADAYKEK